MPRPQPAFLPPTARGLSSTSAPLASAFLPSHGLSARRPPRPARVVASVSPFGPSPFYPPQSAGHPTPAETPPAWNGVRRVVRVSAMSVALLLAGAVGPSRPAPRGLLRAPDAISAPVSGAVKDTSAAGDVEAAAVTLGAVTLGGIIMRVIVRSRRDEDEERRRLAEECKRLEEEEKERALRAKRRKMEAVEGGVVGDDDLMSDFMKRVRSLEREDEDEDEEDGQDLKDAAMRHTPIPDRGTGSAVLDRPDETVPADPLEAEEEARATDAEESEELAKPEELEMLNRMWNLSPPDSEGKGKGKGKEN